MRYRILTISLLLAVLGSAFAFAAEPAAKSGDIPRTADGKPDLSGNYDIATLTPFQRPERFGDNLLLSPEEAQEITEAAAERVARGSQASDPDREAPPEGGDGSPGASGNVGGYNNFWIDRGDDVFLIDGKFRTSIIIDPENGRMPEQTEERKEARAARLRSFRGRRGNDGTAWWLESDGPGPYDDPERRPFGERCILGFGSTQGPPMMPVLYNNLKTIVQTPDHVVLVTEMVHDARIVRLNSEHQPPEIRSWLGDSIGWWDGDTLVVETTNFKDRPGFSRGSKNMKVTERFSRLNANDVLYNFTVEDPSVWTRPFTGEYLWPGTDTRMYEYACHEANYALGNILRGARLLEADIEGAGGGD